MIDLAVVNFERQGWRDWLPLLFLAPWPAHRNGEAFDEFNERTGRIWYVNVAGVAWFGRGLVLWVGSRPYKLEDQDG